MTCTAEVAAECIPTAVDGYLRELSQVVGTDVLPKLRTVKFYCVLLLITATGKNSPNGSQLKFFFPKIECWAHLVELKYVYKQNVSL